MYKLLVESISSLLKSKYSKGNRLHLRSVLSALKQAAPLFLSDPPNVGLQQISFRNIEPENQIPRILDEFIDDFERTLPVNSSAKNYSLFSITSLKIIKALDVGNKRGLASMHVINRLEKMFLKYPFKHSKQATLDPLGTIFSTIEMILESEKNLGIAYKFDKTILDQFAQFIQRYYLRWDDSLGKILEDIEKMPKSRLTVTIDQSYMTILEKIFQYGVASLPQEDVIKKAKELLEKIVQQKEDSEALKLYNVLKLVCSDKDVKSKIAPFARSINKTDKRFSNTILDELSRP
ncbi:MAG TPA: hypothetical protein VFA69_07200 [Candidatus Nitrosotalea sp.]|nr:hypothetical protein [Candidatus Nitrosotalea sp.]